jgi:aminomethyltransferase
MTQIKKTVFHQWHIQNGAVMASFEGWEMPLQYPLGIISEHLTTRSNAGLFDVSHMGRFKVKGSGALPFLQHVLSNNAAALNVGESQYTMIPDENGGAIDDAYLYRFVKDEYLLVVNAANHKKDWEHLHKYCDMFGQIELVDITTEMAMMSLQGPFAKDIMVPLITSGNLPEPIRNKLSIAQTSVGEIYIARTGYTGEPICFEFFLNNDRALGLWKRITAKSVPPIGLGARDTLRLEAGLPLYGHELGLNAYGSQIPIFACPLARFSVSFSPLKGDFIGRSALMRQFNAFKQIIDQKYDRLSDLPCRILPIIIQDRGIARTGASIYTNDDRAEKKKIGYITSGTMVPYWEFSDKDITAKPTQKSGKRAIGLALVESRYKEGDKIRVEVRGKSLKACIVPYHLRSEAPPYARAIVSHFKTEEIFSKIDSRPKQLEKVTVLLRKSVQNTKWRRQECFNLIPSEQTPSAAVRLLSGMDPVGRYAEHKPVKALDEMEVFYYQGTDFIAEVEVLLIQELNRFLGCTLTETRPISGQMANIAVFSAMVDYLNRTDRKREQRRLKSVLNHHIIRGGHLSAQPMGALRDYVARDPQTERPAVINFPILLDNPYQIDIKACKEIIAQYHPELIILGKSMTIHREPVRAIRQIIDELNLDTILMYDMAHVLGLVGPFFQEPFKEGADIVTGSTHKTFFGTQRGVVAADFKQSDRRFEFWEAISRRTFPGAVSNHHLGTLLGLLMATYEMNAFKDDYQTKVLANAKSFALALHGLGLKVAGDPRNSYTETHQIILNIGYAQGPSMARRLEANNIIVNYQATPDEESFSAAGALRMGVAEMTRFGMAAKDFETLAQLIYEIIIHNKNMKTEISLFRKNFQTMHYCFNGTEYDALFQQLHGLIC